MNAIFLLMLFLTPALLFATSSGEQNICYFSLNNEKEKVITKKFVNKINKVSPRKINVIEFHDTDGAGHTKNPEMTFKKMVNSGVRCDGLVISGHHTGGFGGDRANGELSVDFLEMMR
mgnify:CR=1 FL=1